MASYKIMQVKSSLAKSNSTSAAVPVRNVNSKEQFCNFSHRNCLQSPLPGYEYCLQHILEDKLAPYKQCNYIHHKTGRRCPNAAPKSDKREGFCMCHRRKMFVLKKQTMKGKKKKSETLESLITDLEKGYRTELQNSKLENSSLPPQVKNPDTNKQLNTIECQSDTDSDKDPMLVEELFRGDADSDAESLDSDQEEPLKYAGVYTAEEVALITRDKLIRLQSLYLDQFKRLQHVLRERRRKYLKAVKQEKEIYGSISSSPKIGSEIKTYKKLHALNRYHCKRGKEAILQQQNKEKRLAATEGVNYKPPPAAKCIYVEDSVRCTTVPLPNSKYCLKHILNDSHQVLFKPCKHADTGCDKVIVPFQDDTRCMLHASLPGTIEPLVKTLPQATFPKTDPTIITDLDKLLCDPDQFLSSFSNTFSSGPSDPVCATSSATFPVSESFAEPTTSTQAISSTVPSSLSDINPTTSQLISAGIPATADSSNPINDGEASSLNLGGCLDSNTASLIPQPSLLPETSAPPAATSNLDSNTMEISETSKSSNF